MKIEPILSGLPAEIADDLTRLWNGLGNYVRVAPSLVGETWDLVSPAARGVLLRDATIIRWLEVKGMAEQLGKAEEGEEMVETICAIDPHISGDALVALLLGKAVAYAGPFIGPGEEALLADAVEDVAAMLPSTWDEVEDLLVPIPTSTRTRLRGTLAR